MVIWFYTVSHTTTYTLVLLNKFSLIIPCHILLFYMFQPQWLIIRNKLSLELQLASQYHYSIYIYILKGACINKVACILYWLIKIFKLYKCLNVKPYNHYINVLCIIYTLFNDAFNNYVASNERMKGERWIKMGDQGSGRELILKYYHSTCLDGLGKTTKISRQCSWSPGPGPPEYEIGVLANHDE
jgi:hypothetical protein